MITKPLTPRHCFAQELAALLESPDTVFTVPPYLAEAIAWVTP